MCKLISRRSIKLWYFALVKENGSAEELVRSRDSNMRQFQVTVRDVLLPRGEINIYGNVHDDLKINVNIFNGLIHKAQLWKTLSCCGKTGINDTSDALVFVKLFLKKILQSYVSISFFHFQTSHYFLLNPLVKYKKWNIRHSDGPKIILLDNGSSLHCPCLTLSWRRPLSYRNQSMDWFLYDNGLRHERVNLKAPIKVKIDVLCISFFYIKNLKCLKCSGKCSWNFFSKIMLLKFHILHTLKTLVWKQAYWVQNNVVLMEYWHFATAWKVSKYGVIPGLCFAVFRLNTEKYGPELTPYLDTFHAVYTSGELLQMCGI